MFMVTYGPVRKRVSGDFFKNLFLILNAVSFCPITLDKVRIIIIILFIFYKGRPYSSCGRVSEVTE